MTITTHEEFNLESCNSTIFPGKIGPNKELINDAYSFSN